MVTIGAFEAKTHFSEIIQRVKNGEEYLVTKNGKPMVKILPVQDTEEIDNAIKRLMQLRERTVNTTQKEIKEFVNEGRKY